MSANLTPAEWQLILDTLRFVRDEPEVREIVRERVTALVVKLRWLVEEEA